MTIGMPGYEDSPRRRGRPRRGSVLLELEIAFAVLGIMMAGLCPFVVAQIRQARYLEREPPLKSSNSYHYHAIKPSSMTSVTMRKNPFVDDGGLLTATANPGFEYQIVPWTNPWTRKLSGRAQVVQVGSPQPAPATSPEAGTLAPAKGAFALQAIRPDGCVGQGTVTATVRAK
jgi:hypothetical protein